MKLLHNPRCSKSREALKLLRAAGVEPELIEYLKTPLGEAEIRTLLDALGQAPRAAMRAGEKIYRELGLKSADDDALIAAIAAHPILLERPIAVSGDKAVIGRPPENVLTLI